MAWRELAPEVYTKPFYVREFGAAANCLAFRYGPGLAVLSPGPEPTEEDFAYLERRGPVRVLVVPNAAHTLGLREWQRRFPKAQVAAPAPAIPALAKKGIAGVKPLSSLRDDSAVEFRALPGTRTGGTLAIVRAEGRPVVYLDELVMNLAELPRGVFVKSIYWALGSVPGMHFNKIFWWAGVRDAREVVAAYLAPLSLEARFVPAHGTIIERPAEVAALRELVARAAARHGLRAKAPGGERAA